MLLAHEQNDLGLLRTIQSIMDAHEHKSSTSSTGILDGAHDIRIDGANITNVAGNSMVTSSSNTFILVKQESGISIRSVIVLLILVFLFFH